MRRFSQWLVAAFVYVGAACGRGDAGGDDEDGSPAPVLPNVSYADRCDESVGGETDNGTRYAVSGAHAAPFRSVARISLTGDLICSAVLVAPDRLVTAAHCFEESRMPTAVAFADSPSQPDMPAQVTTVVLHPDYAAALRRGDRLATSPTMASVDIAVLTLAHPILDREPATPAADDRLAAGKLVALVGYGDAGLGAGAKRFAQSHVGRRIDHEPGAGGEFHDLLTLDSPTGTGACPGDSGGGVFVRVGDGYQLLGVVSGVNDVLYPGFPVKTCNRCPRGIGIVTLVSGAKAVLDGVGARR